MHITKTLALRGSDQIAHDNGAFDVITSAIESVDLNKLKKKISKEKNRKGEELFSPVEINKAIFRKMSSLGWEEYKKSYFLTGDQQTDEAAWEMPRDEQMSFIKGRGLEPIASYTQSDFLKHRAVIEIQMGKYPFALYDICVKNAVLFNYNNIDVAIEVLPTKRLQKRMSSGPAYFEHVCHKLFVMGEDSRPKAPTLILGIE